MRELIDFLRHNPLLAVIVIGWVVSSLAGIGKQAQRAARRQAPPAGAPPRPARGPANGPPSGAEVARELRRILGMEKRPAAGARPERAAPAPRERPPRRPVVAPERPPQPLAPHELGRVEIHVAPHVGEALEQRKTPATGAVGAKAMGTLGGRAGAAHRVGRRTGSPLLDLHGLPRAIVMREILDRPVALRDLER